MFQPEQEAVVIRDKDYIPMEDCKPRWLYYLFAPDMEIGVYIGKGVFVGLSPTNPKAYMHIERHCDSLVPTKGKAYPQLEIERIPNEISELPVLKNRHGYLWCNSGDTPEKIDVVKRTMLKTGEPRHGLRPDYEDISCLKWTRMPDHEYPFIVGNMALYDFLRQYETTASPTGGPTD